MRIDHLAIRVRDLEGTARSFEEYFGAKVDETYHNPKTGPHSNFLKIDEGPRFEIMTKPNLVDQSSATMAYGYTRSQGDRSFDSVPLTHVPLTHTLSVL